MSEKKLGFETPGQDSAAVQLDLSSERKHSESDISAMKANEFFVECVRIMGEIFSADSEGDVRDALLLLL